METMEKGRVLIIREQDFGRRHSINYGMAIIATILNERFDVKAIDNNSMYTSYSANDFIHVVSAFRPDVICFSIATINAYTSYQTIEILKAKFPNLPIVAGGLHVSHKFEEALKRKIDYVVRGEADLVITPLLEIIVNDKEDNPKEHINLSGVSFYRDNELISGGICPLPMDLDECSHIDYHLFNLSDYLKTQKDINIFGGFLTQRGCPFNCFFCSDIFIRTKIRYRSISNIMSEIEWLYSTHGIDQICINDADFNISDERVIGLCNEIRNRGFHEKIKFVVQSDSFRRLKLSTLRAMKASGFGYMGIGLERMEKTTRIRVNKKLNDKIVLENLRNLKEIGFSVGVNYLTGFTFETEEKLQFENRAFKEILDKYVDIVSVGILLPMPGTKDYEENSEIDKTWYLNPMLFPKYKPLFFSIRGISFDPRAINVFSLNKRIVAEIVRTQNYFKAESVKKKSYLLFILYRFLLVIAAVSEKLYDLNPRIEHAMFCPFKYLFENVSTKLVRFWFFHRNKDPQESKPQVS